MNFVDVFNSTLSDLVADVCRAVPSCADLKVGLRFALNLDAKMCISMFAKYGSKYDEHIKTKNDRVFLEDTFEAASAVPGSFDIIQRLKSAWGGLSAQEKEVVWKYLQGLVVLKNRWRAANSSSS